MCRIRSLIASPNPESLQERFEDIKIAILSVNWQLAGVLAALTRQDANLNTHFIEFIIEIFLVARGWWLMCWYAYDARHHSFTSHWATSHFWKEKVKEIVNNWVKIANTGRHRVCLLWKAIRVAVLVSRLVRIDASHSYQVLVISNFVDIVIKTRRSHVKTILTKIQASGGQFTSQP